VRWHFAFELLAYSVAFRLYLSARQRQGDFLNERLRWSVVVASIVGAAVGSKVLYWLEDPFKTAAHWNDLTYLMGGKTIVGAILGGIIAVEWTKRRAGIRRRTGDLFAIPLAVGIAIGRIGCFFAGKADDTYGIPTLLPWGIDLGDGIPRHPVPLYEMGAMILLAVLLLRIKPPRFQEGDRFRVFVLAYFAWRFAVDFLKPGVRFGGLTLLQWACVAALLWYARDLLRMTASLRTTEVSHG
jgi:phosphatidylglycerol---prolipoprotein diacylglyceryl transferase